MSTNFYPDYVGKPHFPDYTGTTHKIKTDSVAFGFTTLPLKDPTQADFDSALTLQDGEEVLLLDEYLGFNFSYNKIVYKEKIYYIEWLFVTKKDDSIKESIIYPINANKNIVGYETQKIDQWYKKETDKVYYNQDNDLFFVNVELEKYDGTGGSDDQLLSRMQEGLLKGTRLILKNIGKRSSESYVKKVLEKYFYFSKADDWHMPARPCSTLKVLVTLKSNYGFSSDIEDSTSEAAITEDGAIFGMGDLKNTKKFVFYDLTDLNTFSNILKKLQNHIKKYADKQDDSYEDVVIALKTRENLTLEEVKVVAGLDLRKEASKVIEENGEGSLYETIARILYINKDKNGGDDGSSRIINSNNKVVLGYDDDYGITYLAIIRKNNFLNISRLEYETFSNQIGQYGILGKEIGKFLYFYNEIEIDGDGIELETWINKYSYIQPKTFNLDQLKEDCVKNNVKKLLEDAKIITLDAKRIKDTYRSFKDQSSKVYENFPPIMPSQAATKNIDFSKAAGNAGINLGVFIGKQLVNLDWQKLLREVIACQARKVDAQAFLRLIQQFGQDFEKVKKAIEEALCNPLINGAVNFIKIPQFPKIETIDLQQAFLNQVSEAIKKLIVLLLDRAFKALLESVKECQDSDPTSPFNGSPTLDKALADLLNINPDENAAVSDFYDDLGIPTGENSGNTGGTGSAIAEDVKKEVAGLLADIGCVLSATELCTIFLNRNPENISDEIYSIIFNLLKNRYPYLFGKYNNKKDIMSFLNSLGKLLNYDEECRRLQDQIGPASDNNPYCKVLDLDNKTKDALSSKDLTPEQLDKLLNQIANDANKRLADLLDALANAPPEDLPPILCDSLGSEPLVNAAQADKQYAEQFGSITDTFLDQVQTTFESDFTDNYFRSMVDQNMSAAGTGPSGMPNLNDGSGEAIDYSDPTKIVDIVEQTKNNLKNPDSFSIAGVLTDNLKQKEHRDGLEFNKIKFVIDTKKEKERFIKLIGGQLQFAASAEIQRAIEEAYTNITVKWEERIIKAIQLELTNVLTNFGSDATSGGGYDRTIESLKKLGKIAGGNEIIGLVNIITSLKDLFGSIGSQNQQVIWTENGLVTQTTNTSTAESGSDTGVTRYESSGPIGDRPRTTVVNVSVTQNGTRQITTTTTDNFSLIPNPLPNAQQNFNTNDLTRGDSSYNNLASSFDRLGNKINGAVDSFFSGDFSSLVSSDLTVVRTIADVMAETLRQVKVVGEAFQRIGKAYKDAAERAQQINQYSQNYKFEYQYGSASVGEEIKIAYRLRVEKGAVSITGSDNNEFTTPVESYKLLYDLGKVKTLDKNISNFIKENKLSSDYSASSGKTFQQHTFEKYLQFKQINTKKKYKDIENNFLNNFVEQITSSYLLGFDNISASVNSANNTTSYNTGESASETLEILIPKLKKFNILEIKSQKQAQCAIKNSILDLDNLKDDTVNEFVNNPCNYEPPDVGGNARDKMNPVEQTLSDALVKLTIRVYLYDYYLKGIIPFSTYKPGQTLTDVSIDFIAASMEDEMKSLDRSYFDKFLDECTNLYNRNTNKLEIKNLENSFDAQLVNPLRVKRAKFKELIKLEIPKISRNLDYKLSNVAPKFALPDTINNVFLRTDSFSEDFNIVSDSNNNITITFERVEIISGNFATITNSPEYKFLFEFVFPLKDYLSLYEIYCSLCTNTRKFRVNTFKATKNKLRMVHDTAMSAGGINYTDSLSAITTSAMLNAQNNPEAIDDDTWAIIIKFLIKTPLDILKALCETADPNIALSSFPYKTAKMILMSNKIDIPSAYSIPFSSSTPLFSGLLTGFAFLPPTAFGWFYLILLQWLDLGVDATGNPNVVTVQDIIDQKTLGRNKVTEEDCKAIKKEIKKSENVKYANLAIETA